MYVHFLKQFTTLLIKIKLIPARAIVKVNDVSEMTVLNLVTEIPELKEIPEVTEEFVVSEVTWEVFVA